MHVSGLCLLIWRWTSDSGIMHGCTWEMWQPARLSLQNWVPCQRMEIRTDWTTLLTKLWQQVSGWVSANRPWNYKTNTVLELAKTLKQNPQNILPHTGISQMTSSSHPPSPKADVVSGPFYSPPEIQEKRKEKKRKYGIICPIHLAPHLLIEDPHGHIAFSTM